MNEQGKNAGMMIAGNGAPELGALMREQRASRMVAGAYPDGNPNAAVASQTHPPCTRHGIPLCVACRRSLALVERLREPWRGAAKDTDAEIQRLYALCREAGEEIAGLLCEPARQGSNLQPTP